MSILYTLRCAPLGAAVVKSCFCCMSSRREAALTLYSSFLRHTTIWILTIRCLLYSTCLFPLPQLVACAAHRKWIYERGKRNHKYLYSNLIATSYSIICIDTVMDSVNANKISFSNLFEMGINYILQNYENLESGLNRSFHFAGIHSRSHYFIVLLKRQNSLFLSNRSFQRLVYSNKANMLLAQQEIENLPIATLSVCDKLLLSKLWYIFTWLQLWVCAANSCVGEATDKNT